MPHSPDSLAALFGHPINKMRSKDGIHEVEFLDDWEPDAAEKAALREAIELGQEI